MRKILILLCFFLSSILAKEITTLNESDSSIEIDENGIHYYTIHFPTNPLYSTYYIATEEKEKEKDIKLFLGGDCIDNCSNLVSEPDGDINCGERKKFHDDYYLIKLIPNKACSLFFSIETKIKTKLITHYQSTIQVQDIQTILLNFNIPNAPIFLEYIPKFPATFISIAKIYVDLAEKNVKAVYFGKESEYQECNTPYPDEETHCFSFQLPSYEKPRSYFIAFDYVTVLTSNLHIAIYPKEGIKSTKVTIGYTMPFIVDGLTCPPLNYLAIQNSDIYCAKCTKDCQTCNESQCLECKKDYAFLNNSCYKHDCDTFKQYKDKKGNCVDCEENCKFCMSEKTCLECKENYTRIANGSCQLKGPCNASQYFNNTLKKCVNCSEGCEICANSETCQKCYKEGYSLEKQNLTCIKHPQCLLHQFLNENKTCQNCSDNCTKCSNETNCLTCDKKNVVRKGICVPDCGNNKFHNFDIDKCDNCVEHCKECSNNQTCDICKGGFYKDNTTQCKESPLCRPNQYLSNIGDTCLNCPVNCTSCRNSTFCQTCKHGFSIVDHQICAPSCEKYKFYNITSQKCDSCIEHCENCLDGSSCEKCRNGFSFNFVEQLGSCIQSLVANGKSSFIALIGGALLVAINIII